MIAYAAALVVAAVLAIAAAAKLTHRAQTVSGFTRLGLPRPSVLAWVVPAVEVAVAVALVVAPGWGGVVAFALLAGFTAYLAGLIRSGRVVACGCFGSAGDRPVAPADLVRNAMLLASAALAVTVDGPLPLEPATLGLAALALVVGATLVRALRRFRLGGAAAAHR